MATTLLTISDLKYGVRLTQMSVRVVHKWSRPEFKDRNKTEDKKKIDAIELLLVDSKNEVIQATVRKQLISYFGSKLSVGEATPNPYRLKFEFSSQVHATNDPSLLIHGYRFANFKDIIDDVIGKLYEIGPNTETTNKHKCRTIKVEDFEGTQLSSTLWEPHTVQLRALTSKLPNPKQSKIVVIQCVQTKRYEGHWRVQTTFNATVFNANPDIPEVKVFEPRSPKMSYLTTLTLRWTNSLDNRPRFTPRKRPSPSDVRESRDASSATKKTAFVKKEK